MLNITIEFDTDNACFEDDFSGAVEYVLQQATRKVLGSSGEGWFKLLDPNGNAVGQIQIRARVAPRR